MKIQSNRGSKRHKRGGGTSLSECMPYRQSLEYQQRASRFLEVEDGNLQNVLNSTMAKLLSVSFLTNKGIHLYGRIKSSASISDKMSTYNLGIHQVMDIVGVRAITRHKTDCYRLVGQIYCKFKVLKHKYSDYITAPKPNGYQSIHITVIGPNGFPVEIQIRTQRMQNLCEQGAAAHSLYKKKRLPWVPTTQFPLGSFK